MPQIYCLDIEEDRAADAAKVVLNVHVAVIVFAAIIAAIGVVATIQAQKGMESFQGLTNTGSSNRNTILSQIGMVNVVMEVAFPAASFCLLHFSIRNNTVPLLNRVHNLDSVGIFISCVFIGVFVFWSYTLYDSKKTLSSYACPQPTDTSAGAATAFDLCEQKETSTANYLNLGMVFCLTSGGMLLVQACLCYLGTLSVTQALSVLDRGQSFTRKGRDQAVQDSPLRSGVVGRSTRMIPIQPSQVSQ